MAGTLLAASRPLGKDQDFYFLGNDTDITYFGVLDGHGRDDCIQFARTLDFHDIATQPDPAQTLWDHIQGINFAGSGFTFTCARINHALHLIEVWNVGDSETIVYLNDQVFRTELHNFHNPKEVERTKHLVYSIRKTTAAKPSSSFDILDIPSFTGDFILGDSLVPSQSYGHNGTTGFAPHKLTIPYKHTDRVRIVCVTDGVSDMQVDLSRGSAEDIVQEAQRKWHQPWNYKGFPGIHFQNVDDITAVVWEN